MGGVDKVFAPLCGRPAVAWVLDALEEAPSVDGVLLVLNGASLAQGEDLVRRGPWRKVWGVCVGGERRQDSVRRGLEGLPPCHWVVVHDAARPCLTPALVEEGLLAAEETGAAIAAIPATETIKKVDPAMWVVETLPREHLRVVQTPQVFRRPLLEEAHRSIHDPVTDDATMVERLGARVKVFPGDYANLKITTPQDLLLAEAILRARRVPTEVSPP